MPTCRTLRDLPTRNGTQVGLVWRPDETGNGRTEIRGEASRQALTPLVDDIRLILPHGTAAVYPRAAALVPFR
ncbi:hypothetical protein J6590_047940 [Homalodisca vitripennis]|nr:hypothetical protein J6590_047940 [Homalodisca vitripennis]